MRGRLVSCICLLGIAAGLYLLVHPDAPPETRGSLEEDPKEAAAPLPMLRGTRDADAPTAPGPAETAVPAPPRQLGQIHFSGTVIGEDLVPAARVAVVARFQGRVVARVRTDARGYYAFLAAFSGLDPSQPAHGSVVATAVDGRVGGGRFEVQRPARGQATALPRDRTIRAIKLGAPHGVDVRVTSACGGGLPATVYVALIQPGVLLGGFKQVVTDSGGHARIEGIPAGGVHLVASAKGCGRAAKSLLLPQQEAKAIELELPPSHRLTVTVAEVGGEPIPGAEVTIEQRVRAMHLSALGSPISIPARYTTDARGQVVIEGLSSEDRTWLRVTAEGFPQSQTRWRDGAHRVEPGTTEMAIELGRPRNVRWPIEDRGHGIPPDGTVVHLRPRPGTRAQGIPEAGRIEAGTLIVEGWQPGYATAFAYAEGRGAAQLHADPGEETGRAIAFYPLRRIVLVARRPDGTPAEGLHFFARGMGDHQLQPFVKTDADGRAVIDQLFGGPGARANCFVRGAGTRDPTWPVGSVDLHRQDGYFEFTTPEERLLRLTLRVDGRPPPEGFRATLRFGAQFLELVPDKDGVCTARVQPLLSGQTQLVVLAHGYTQLPKTSVDLGQRGVIEALISFVQQTAVNLEVRLPEDGHNKLVVQAYSEDEKAWPPPPSANSYNFVPTGKVLRSSGIFPLRLVPGRYRVVDAGSGKVGEPFEVGPEPGTAPMFDLSKSGWVKGRIVVPAGVSLSGFRVVEDGDPLRATSSPLSPPTGVGVHPQEGTFWFRVPGDREVTLRVVHPTYMAHPTRGFVTVTGPREDVVLHATTSTTARLVFDPAIRIWLNPGQPRQLTVRLYAGEISGEGFVCTGLLDKDAKRFQFGGFQPGRYTVWIDTHTAAPLVLSDVELGSGDLDLGTHVPPKGSRFILHVKVKEGQSPPEISLRANKLEPAPTYTRSTDRAGERIVLGGLGPGRFRIQAHSHAGTGYYTEEIEVDGTHDVERTWDLR